MTKRVILSVATAWVVLSAGPAWSTLGMAAPATPTIQECQAVRAHRAGAPVEAYDPRPGAPRVFAMQFKQDVANVVSYAAFQAKIECLLRQYVLPHLAVGRPNVVVFNEDVGLLTLAIGTRGAAARDAFARRGGPGCESQGAPCTTLGALAAISAAYAPQIAAYHARFPTLGSVSQAFVAATDTMVRGFMETFSGLARRYGVYIVGSNDQAPFTESSNPADLAAFSDPDQPRPSFVYVATSPDVYNQVFMWGPHDVRSGGPEVLRNLVATNQKVPLTPIENELQLTPGPSTGPAAVANLAPYALPGTNARIGFATSLPAFVYGDPVPGTDPCSDTSLYYMRCLDRLGANLVIQDEANPGRWTGPDGNGVEQWQPLSWMASTYRAVSDPTVHFDYNVTAMMVGNLADLVFDGQSAITERGGLAGRGCHYIGNSTFIPGQDSPEDQVYAGSKPDFLALAPWVVPDGPRDYLRAIGAKLAPGSGDPLENDYLETALIADLPFPPGHRRPACAGGAGTLGNGSGRLATSIHLTVAPRTTRVGRSTRFRFSTTIDEAHGRGSLARARITFDGHSVRTDGHGQAVIVARASTPGRLVAVARKRGLSEGKVAVTVRPASAPSFTG